MNTNGSFNCNCSSGVDGEFCERGDLNCVLNIIVIYYDGKLYINSLLNFQTLMSVVSTLAPTMAYASIWLDSSIVYVLKGIPGVFATQVYL